MSINEHPSGRSSDFDISGDFSGHVRRAGGCSGSNPGSEVDAVLERALRSADLGDWDTALKLLDEAETIAPGDPRIVSYRASFLELYALDDAQQSWVDGESTEVAATGGDEGDTGTVGDEAPKFVLDRGDKDLVNKPAMFRDNLRADLSLKLFALNPDTNEISGTWSTGNEFLYSSLRFDLRYWMPFLGRSIGFNFRSNGYSWEPGEPEILFNTLDLGINLRGFLLESVTSRLEIGLDFGASMQTGGDTAPDSSKTFALYLGLWASDPIFYHLFRVESMENLVFGGGLRIYSTAENQLSDNICLPAGQCLAV